MRGAIVALLARATPARAARVAPPPASRARARPRARHRRRRRERGGLRARASLARHLSSRLGGVLVVELVVRGVVLVLIAFGVVLEGLVVVAAREGARLMVLALLLLLVLAMVAVLGALARRVVLVVVVVLDSRLFAASGRVLVAAATCRVNECLAAWRPVGRRWTRRAISTATWHSSLSLSGWYFIHPPAKQHSTLKGPRAHTV